MDGRAASRLFAHYFVAPFAPDLQLPWGNILTPKRESLVSIAALVRGILLMVSVVGWYLRRRRFETALAVNVLAASVAALLAVRRLEANPSDHRVYWVSVLGVMAWVVILALPIDMAFAAAGRRLPAARVMGSRSVARVAMASTLLIGVWQVAEMHAYFVSGSGRINDLTRVVRTEIDRTPGGPPLLHVAQANWAPISGVVLQLDRAGLMPHVDADRVQMFGPRFSTMGLERVVFRFADSDEHLTELRFRRDYRLVGSVDNIFVYVQEPAPSASLLTTPLRLRDSSYDITGDAKSLVDGVWPLPPEAALSMAAVTFSGPSASVTVAVTDTNVVGIRVWGQPSSDWQFLCSADGSVFTGIGRVHIADGSGAQLGDAYLRDLSGCRQLRVAPFAGAWWLTEIQLLVGGPAGVTSAIAK